MEKGGKIEYTKIQGTVLDARLLHLARRKVVVEGSRVGGIGEQLGQRDAVLLGNHLETQEVAIYTSALDNLIYSRYW